MQSRYEQCTKAAAGVAHCSCTAVTSMNKHYNQHPRIGKQRQATAAQSHTIPPMQRLRWWVHELPTQQLPPANIAPSEPCRLLLDAAAGHGWCKLPLHLKLSVAKSLTASVDGQDSSTRALPTCQTLSLNLPPPDQYEVPQYDTKHHDEWHGAPPGRLWRHGGRCASWGHPNDTHPHTCMQAATACSSKP
jgi:hypothetical protein